MSPELLRVADWLIVAVLVAILLGPVWLVVRVVRHRRLTGPERAERRRTTWLIARVWLSAVAVFVIVQAAFGFYMLSEFRAARECLHRERARGTDSREIVQRCATGTYTGGGSK